jgi:hypothetical protein
MAIADTHNDTYYTQLALDVLPRNLMTSFLS